MRKYNRNSWSLAPCDNEVYPIEALLKMVDEGKAELKAGLDIGNRILINITPYCNGFCRSNYYYSGRVDMSWEQFNEKYGHDYIGKWNLYL